MLTWYYAFCAQISVEWHDSFPQNLMLIAPDVFPLNLSSAIGVALLEKYMKK